MERHRPQLETRNSGAPCRELLLMGAGSPQRLDQGDQRRSSKWREEQAQRPAVSCLPATDSCSAGLLCVTRQGLKDKRRGFVFR